VTAAEAVRRKQRVIAVGGKERVVASLGEHLQTVGPTHKKSATSTSPRYLLTVSHVVAVLQSASMYVPKKKRRTREDRKTLKIMVFHYAHV
jgi:16S rRNA G1207 methylase RsmC